MTRQLMLYMHLNALCVCVLAFSPINSVHYVENISNGAKENINSIPKSDQMVIEKPVHKRFPHALLFARTCGGTILSPTWVLTAAHCTLNGAGDHVLAGTSNSNDGSGIVSLVKRRIIHPRFTIGPYWLNADEYNLKQVSARFDFLLAELENPLPLDNINLAAVKLNEYGNMSSKTLVAYAGFGTSDIGGFMSEHMHERNLEMLSEDECSVLQEYDSLDMICAKGLPPIYNSACQGDSGSGLVDENGVLVGVLSWGEADKVECRDDAIIYFGKVAEVRDWIREVTNL